jgi:WD40 repeat protein
VNAIANVFHDWGLGGHRSHLRQSMLTLFCSYNSLAPQYITVRTKGASEIAALDINQERTHAILAGREILETITVAGINGEPRTNIRQAVINNDRHNATRHRDNLDIHDVKWSHGQYNSTIATAATNGKVVIYDLNRPGVEVARLHEHHRQVHKVAFNPHHGALLLSGSQDATVRLWDLRAMKADVMAFPSRTQFKGQSDGVRDLKWSPTDVVEFAFGTDSGVIQGWDYRNAKSAKLKISAHDKCTAIDWHPDGKHLLSAGLDKNLRVWDFSSDQRRQKPAWTLRCPYPVMNARWRPPCWAGDDQGRGNWQCTQVITSYPKDYPTMNLWDFRRPFMPFREMSPSVTAPTDMLWLSQHLLWSVSRDGVFYQTDVKFAPKTIDRRPLTTFAISNLGDIVVFAQKRPRRRGSEFDYPIPGLAFPGTRRASRSAAQNAEVLISSADDTLDDSFLSSSYQKHHERTLSNRSTKSVVGTPPTLQEAGGVAVLSNTLNEHKHSYQPKQTAYRGPLEGLPSHQAFSYLAQKYKTSALPDHPTVDDYLRVHKVFEQNALYAEKTSNHRMAQTWRLFGTTLQGEILQRATHNKKVRLGLAEAKLDPTLVLPNVVEVEAKGVPSIKVPAPALRNAEVRAIQSAMQESSSNVPTPVARPMYSSSWQMAQRNIPNPDHGEQLSLGPSVMAREPVLVGDESSYLKSVDNRDASVDKADAALPTFEEPRWYSSAVDLDERKAMAANYRAPPKLPLNLETPSKQSSAINIPPPLDRHNSDESFAMFSASSDSKGGPSMAASYSSFRSRKQSMSSIPEHMRVPHSFQYESSLAEDYAPVVTGSSQSSSSKVRKAYSHSSSYSFRSHTKQDGLYNASYTSNGSGSLLLSESPLGSRNSSQQHFDSNGNMEASGTIIPEEHTQRLEVPVHTPQRAVAIPSRKQKLTEAEMEDLREQFDSLPFVLDDFTNQELLMEDRSYPCSVGKLLEQMYLFYAGEKPDAQHIFHIVALLRPFLPGSVVKRTHYYCDPLKEKPLGEEKELLLEYAKYCFNALNLTDDDVATMLATPLTHIVRFGIKPLEMEIAWRTYQTLLHQGQIFNTYAVVRKMGAESFGGFKEENLQEQSTYKMGLFCLACSRSIRRKDKICDHCKKEPAHCPVCWMAHSPFTATKRTRKLLEQMQNLVPSTIESSDDDYDPDKIKPSNNYPVLWQSCTSCGHGSHAACMAERMGDREIGGCCPEPMCGCPCLPGPYRDRYIREEEEERARAEAGTVRADERRVGESRAVKGARGILDEGKRVRVVEPGKE